MQTSGPSAVSVDALVDGVHFRRDTASPRSIGRKALAAALSDLAAVGATPGEAYVAIGIPEDLGEGPCLELADGLIEGGREWSTAVAGGDVTGSPVLFVSVTVVGELASADDGVARAGASPGEVLAVTGELGGAAAGLLLLERPELASGVPAEVATRLRERQLAPSPRLEAGRALASSGATAMIDLSDGLGADAGHLAEAGGVRIEIALERIPIAEGVAETAAAARVDPVQLAAAGGEDYELAVCLPRAAMAEAAEAVTATGAALTEIGTVADGDGRAVLLDANGAEVQVAGFEHLRAGAERARSA